MRRKDREITNVDEIYSIMREAYVCRIGLVDDGIPYIVPMNFGIGDGCIYIHSANEGKKIELLKTNNTVCFETDILEQIVSGDRACKFTARYKSVIGWGNALFINDSSEKKKALNAIMTKYSEMKNNEYTEQELDGVTIIKIEIKSMSGKKKE